MVLATALVLIPAQNMVSQTPPGVALELESGKNSEHCWTLTYPSKSSHSN